MQVKKYRTKSIHEAISRIKKDMGPDAMILSTKRVSKKTPGLYGRDCFEVSALPNCRDELQKPGSCFIENDKLLNTEHLETIQSDIVGIKDMLFLLNQFKGMPDFFQSHPECLQLYAKLISSGVSEERTKQILVKSCLTAIDEQADKRKLTKRVLREIHRSIASFNPFTDQETARADVGFVGFVGPTGVGKTTTIAKLAADLHLKHKKKVGLISIDNYRIGAVEQLRTYASIIGIPFLTAFAMEDITRAVKKMETRDIVLVDTAGMSHLDAIRLKELSDLLGGYPKISIQLVLSATTRRVDMKEIVDHFAMFNPKSYVFTKLDETRRCGGIIDQVFDYRLPVSFFTNGQRVPEDIVEVTRRDISRMILNV